MADAPAPLADPTAFLATSPAAGWSREPLAGDASGRRYERLRAPDGLTAILMDATAEPGSVEPFTRLGAHLRALGLCAPAVLAASGPLLVIEDLGPVTVADWLRGRPGDAQAPYAAAVDALARLQAAPPPPGLKLLDPDRAAAMLDPTFEHYAPAMPPNRAAALRDALREALARHAPRADVLALRDFHAENLVWRPERTGLDRLGLLDFQDAVLAAPEYDLASLLRDARCDTDAPLRAAMTRRFAAATGRAEAEVALAAAALGVARNLRILGVFARLARERGRPGYRRLLPRVWSHVEDDLRNPALAPLAAAVRAALPPPTEAAA